MKSDKKVIAFPKPNSQPHAEEREFLPAALEIVETPASPAGRTIAYMIVASFCLSLLWASLAKVDIVASSSGKVVLLDGTKVIQPLETGIVRTIHVRDGQNDVRRLALGGVVTGEAGRLALSAVQHAAEALAAVDGDFHLDLHDIAGVAVEIRLAHQRAIKAR